MDKAHVYVGKDREWVEFRHLTTADKEAQRMSQSVVVNWFVYQDPWLDNGLENFYRILKSVQANAPNAVDVQLTPDELRVEVREEDRFINLVSAAIAKWRDEYLFCWDTDEKTGIKTNKKKAFIALQYDKKQGNVNRVKEKIFQDEEVLDIVKQIIAEAKSEKRKKICILCGRKFHKALTHLKQAVYPMVTKIRSLSGVRTKIKKNGALSGWKYNYNQLCPFCYVIGVLEWCDPGLVYRTGLSKSSIVLLPTPRATDLNALHQLKRGYSGYLHPQEKRSNVRVHVFKRRRESRDATGGTGTEFEEQEEYPVGPFTLLLGFYEKVIRDIASETEYIDLKTVKRTVSDAWLAIEIPEGQVKNIQTSELIVEDRLIHQMSQLIEHGILSYGHFIGPLLLANDERKFVNDNALIRERKEGLAEAFIEDDYDQFAAAFTPQRRTHLALSAKAEAALEQIINVWRWKAMPLGETELDTVKKAARAVAKIAGKNISIFYSVEKARSVSDLLEALKEVAHKLVGLEQKDLQYVSVDSIEKFIEMVHLHSDRFKDLKNTLTIFAAIEYGRQIFHRGETS